MFFQRIKSQYALNRIPPITPATSDSPLGVDLRILLEDVLVPPDEVLEGFAAPFALDRVG